MGTNGIVEEAASEDRGEASSRHGRQTAMIVELPKVADHGPNGAQTVEHLRRLGPDHRRESGYALRRDALFRRLLAVADILGAVGAILVSEAVTAGGAYPIGVYLGIPFVVLVSKLFGIYDRDELVVGKSSLPEAPALFQLATLYTLLLVVALAGSGSQPDITATAMLTLWGSVFLGILGCRVLARALARVLTTPEQCLVLGDPEQALRIGAKFAFHSSLHAEIVANLPYDQFELGRPRDGDFGKYIAERGIDRVIVAPSDSPDRVLETVRYFKEYDLKVSVIPDLLEVVGSSVEFDEIYGTTLLGVRDFELSRSSRILKRGFDICGSLVLLFVSLPLFALMVAAVKLTSPGPTFFRQTRVGRDGEPFTMIKFRTMHEGAEGHREALRALNETDGLFKVANDPRVTAFGRALRRSSLDELPQLANVLAGDMSLVGPRPLVLDEDALVEGWHRRRLHLKPGMTGAWQIMGHARVPLREMVSMDYLYIVNWSVWSDVRILLQTVGHVLGRRGL
jgi:exopolysaccharide biosynthesis polyprenyl glycosylphosphotransferase